MNDLIQQLKENLATLRGMDGNLRRAMESMNKKDFIFLLSDGTWDKANPKQGWEYEIYRLRPDYKEEPEIVEFDVYEDGGLLVWGENSNVARISEVIDDPDFIGFKYEDGIISTSPRLYDSMETSTSLSNYRFNEICFTPIQVLFRRSK